MNYNELNAKYFPLIHLLATTIGEIRLNINNVFTLSTETLNRRTVNVVEVSVGYFEIRQEIKPRFYFVWFEITCVAICK